MVNFLAGFFPEITIAAEIQINPLTLEVSDPCGGRFGFAIRSTNELAAPAAKRLTKSQTQLLERGGNKTGNIPGKKTIRIC